ncbi:MAG: hypothetical protein ABFS30_16305, partial [Pseudomonadota bacterium]
MRGAGLAAVCATFMAFAFPPNAGADVVKEAPWSPLAKVYLFGIFVSGLRPVDWTGIERRFASRRRPDQGGKSAYDLLAPVDAFAKADHAAAIRAAIRKRDRNALRAESTRALSRAARYHLHEAGWLLGTKSGGARRHALAAQEHYRPFAGFVRQADPDGFRRLGLAWLELTTLAGRKLEITGMRQPRARAQFDRASRPIEDYLIASYEAPPTPSIARRGPIPDRGRGREPGWRPAPWLPPDANIVDQAPLIQDQVLAGLEALATWLSESGIGDQDEIVASLQELISGVIPGVAGWVTTAFSGVAAFAIGVFAALFILYFVLSDWDELTEWVASHMG